MKKSWFQMLKFFLFSISAGVIQALTFFILNESFTLPYWPAYLVALVLSIVWNFTLNRKFTFKSAVNVPRAMAQLFGYYLVFTPVSTYLGDVCAVSGVNEYLVLGVTMLSNLITEFLFCKLVIYRGNEDTAKR